MQQFESLKKILPPDDTSYRLAQELSHELSISYNIFSTSIMNAIAKCASNGCDVPLHFTTI